MHPALGAPISDFHVFRTVSTSFQGSAPNALDTIGSVRQRIAIFETLSTGNKLASSRKSDSPPEVAEVSKHEKHSPFWEGPSELYEKPKTIPYKPESDQSDAKETGKLFLFSQIEKTGHLDGMTKAQSKTYGGYDKTQKGRCDVQKYIYESDRTAESSQPYEVQKYILSEHNDTSETVVSEWMKQNDENKNVKNIGRQKLAKWEQEQGTGLSNDLEVVMQRRFEKIVEEGAKKFRELENNTENEYILKPITPLEIKLQQTVTQEVFTQKGDQETYSEIHAVERWEIIDKDELHAVTKVEIVGKEVKSKGSVSATQEIPAIETTIDSESTTWKILIPTEKDFGLENVLPENDTIKDKALILQYTKELPMEKLNLKKDELPKKLAEKGDIYSRMMKDEESIATSTAERSELDFLKNKTGEPEVIVLSPHKEMRKDELNVTDILLENPTKKSSPFFYELSENSKKKDVEIVEENEVLYEISESKKPLFSEQKVTFTENGLFKEANILEISPVKEKVKQRETSIESNEISDEILQSEKLKAQGNIVSMTRDEDLIGEEKKLHTLLQTITFQDTCSLPTEQHFHVEDYREIYEDTPHKALYDEDEKPKSFKKKEKKDDTNFDIVMQLKMKEEVVSTKTEEPHKVKTELFEEDGSDDDENWKDRKAMSKLIINTIDVTKEDNIYLDDKTKGIIENGTAESAVDKAEAAVKRDDIGNIFLSKNQFLIETLSQKHFPKAETCCYERQQGDSEESEKADFELLLPEREVESVPEKETSIAVSERLIDYQWTKTAKQEKMYYMQNTQLEWLLKDGKYQFQEDEMDKPKMISLRRERQFDETGDKTSHARKDHYSPPFASEEAINKPKRFHSAQPYVELSTTTRTSQMQNYKLGDTEALIHQIVGGIKSASIEDIEITVQQEVRAHHDQPENIETFIQKEMLANQEIEGGVRKKKIEVEEPNTTFICILNYNEMSSESEHLRQESWDKSYKSPIIKETKEEEVEVHDVKLQQIKMECSENKMEKVEEISSKSSQKKETTVVRMEAESIKLEKMEVSTTLLGGVKKSSRTDEVVEEPLETANNGFWCDEKMDERLTEYKEDEVDESMKRSGEICVDQPHYQKFRKSVLDRPEILIKTEELYKFPHKEVGSKVPGTTKKEREVKTREEHKQISEYPESVVKTEEEWTSKSIETIDGHAELEPHSKWPEVEKSVQETLISAAEKLANEEFLEQIEFAGEGSRMEADATFNSEEIQDVIMSDDDEIFQHTFLDYPDLGELNFEKVIEGISERWSENTKKISENIPKEAGSVQKLQDFHHLVNIQMKDTKRSEEGSKINVEVISLNSEEKCCDDLSESLTLHAEGEMKHVTAIYERTQEGMKDEEREWKKVGKIKDIVVDIKRVNEASSELDFDDKDADIPSKKSGKTGERQVTKYGRAIENVAGERHKMDGNYPQNTEVEISEKRMISRELTSGAEAENQMWSEERKEGESSFFNDAEESNHYDKHLLAESSFPDFTEIAESLTTAGRENEEIPEKYIKGELNGKHNGTEMDTVEILQMKLECVEKVIYEVGQQQLSKNEIALGERKTGEKEKKGRTEVGKRPTGDVKDIVIRLEDGKTSGRTKEISEAFHEDTMKVQTEQILNEHINTLSEKPVPKYFQKYNILGQKNCRPKESTTFEHEIFVEQEKSKGILSLKAMNGSQERDAERTPVVEVFSDRKNGKQKNMESENNKYKTTTTEKVYTEHLKPQNLIEAGLTPYEEVLENVSMEYEQGAMAVQCEMSDIHSDLITSKTAKKENLKKDRTVINSNHEGGETSQDGFLSFDNSAGIVSASMIATPVALAAVGAAVAYECMTNERQIAANSDLEDKMFNIKKLELMYKAESKETEIPSSKLEVGAKKTKPFKDIVSDREVLEKYGTIISKEPITRIEHMEIEGWTESDENQLNKTEEFEKTETKTFEDIIPVKEVFE
ncbi:unnamed protein product, partial [Acanthocheilonema viteae]